MYTIVYKIILKGGIIIVAMTRTHRMYYKYLHKH